jgi:predicted transglutaminase-like cysteine proteinase
MIISRLLIAALLAAGANVAGAHAQTITSPFNGSGDAKIVFGQAAATPKGYYEMCVRRPALCRIGKGRLPTLSDGSVPMTPAIMRQLKTVNAEVNAAVNPSRREDWGAGDSVGDCKDFALTKQQRLLSQGWPSSAVRAAIVRVGSGERHMVLVARTGNGDFVLDNLSAQVLPWAQVPYIWDKIQSKSDMWRWNSL